MAKRSVSLTIVLAAVAAPTDAQTVSGRVTSETGTPVGVATVTLVLASYDIVRRTVTDRAGRYSLQAPESGEYRVVADHLGYRRLESPLASMEEHASLVIDFELPIDPVELEGLRVEAERREELVRRVEQYGVKPEVLGSRFVPRSEMEKRPTALNVGEVLQWQNLAGIRVHWGNSPPGICIIVARGRDACALTVLDGVLVDDEVAASVPPDALEAAVILRPTEATLSYGTIGSVGALLLFTRVAVVR